MSLSSSVFPTPRPRGRSNDSPEHQQALKDAGDAFTREVVIVEGA